MSGTARTFLEILNICDNFRPIRIDQHGLRSSADSETLIPWCLSSAPDGHAIGLLRPVIVEQLCSENIQNKSKGALEVWDIHLESTKPRIAFQSWLDTPSKRTLAMQQLCEKWRDTGLFNDVCGLKKWRAEMYAVYKEPFGPRDCPADPGQPWEGNYAFEMERSACALFGVVTYGVHMTIFQVDSQSNMHIWVPTRAATKQTWPGYLDNSVAGGIPSGMGTFDSIVKEAMEEASIEEDIVRKHARAAGSISYFFRTANGWLQPEIQFVYDLTIPVGANAVQPKPLDGEVESFQLLPLNHVIAKMRAGQFKPNCAMVLIDFLIRHGYLTADNEPHFLRIMTQLHGRFGYDSWCPS